ncbi:MAG: hypothetical protein NW241_21240 [Bacteroidia bacterium]|nr:hypothetical protein [Bacteroidia bacterium]
MKYWIICLAVFGAMRTGPAGRPAPGDAAPSFRSEVFPIIQTKCNIRLCHGERGSVPFANYALVKRNAQNISKRIADPKAPMPPKDSNIRLSAEEMQTIRKWVAAGAPQN